MASNTIQFFRTVTDRIQVLYEHVTVHEDDGPQIRPTGHMITTEAEKTGLRGNDEVIAIPDHYDAQENLQSPVIQEKTNSLSIGRMITAEAKKTGLRDNDGAVGIPDQCDVRENLQSPVIQEKTKSLSVAWNFEKYYVIDKKILQKCMICGFVSDHEHLREHLFLHEYNQLTCRQCKNKFKKKKELVDHILSHDQLRPFRCLKCLVTFKLKCAVVRHLQAVHGIKYSCPHCKIQSDNYIQMVRHFTNMCALLYNPSKSSSERKCEFVSGETSAQEYAKYDNKSLTRNELRPVRSVDGISEDQGTYQMLNSKGEINQGRRTETVCFDGFNRNVPIQLNEDISPVRNFSCLHCDQTFPDKDKLHQHWTLHDDEILVLEDNNIDHSTDRRDVTSEVSLVDDDKTTTPDKDLHDGLFANLSELATYLSPSKQTGSSRSPTDVAECNGLSSDKKSTLHEPYFARYYWILDGNDLQYSLALKQEEYFVGQWMRNQLV